MHTKLSQRNAYSHLFVVSLPWRLYSLNAPFAIQKSNIYTMVHLLSSCLALIVRHIFIGGFAI